MEIEMARFEGGCLCGDVRYSCDKVLMTAHCHCLDCRKSSGTDHCTHVMTQENHVSISGEVSFFEKAADSGAIVSRGFCGRCGSALYSTKGDMPGVLFLRASSLDDPEIVKPEVTVYTKQALSWSMIDPALPQFEEMPPAAATPSI